MEAENVYKQLDELWQQRESFFQEMVKLGMTVEQRSLVSQFGAASLEIGELSVVYTMMREYGVKTS